MNENKIVIELTVPEEDWKKYGEVSAIITPTKGGGYGGVTSWDNLVTEMKNYFERLPKEEKKTLSDYIVDSPNDEELIPLGKAKEKLKEFIDDITDDSITLPDANYMRKKAKEIFGKRLIK